MLSAPSSGIHAHEHRGQDREVLGHVVGDGEGRDRATRDEQLLADGDDLEQLGRVGVQVDHVGRFLGRRGAAVHGQAHVRLGERRSVVRAVTGHGHEVAVGLLLADEADLVLRLGLGDEVVHAGLAGDRGGRPRVVAGDHDRPDAHLAEFGEPLDEAFLDGVLELDQADDAAVAPHRQGGRPGVGQAVRGVADERRQDGVQVVLDGIDGTLEHRLAAGQPDAARAGLGAEGDVLRDGRGQGLVAGVVRRCRPGAPNSVRRLRASSTTERPSGVSSCADAMRAAVAASASVTPGAAVIEAARRLP